MPDKESGIRNELGRIFDEVQAYFNELEGESPRAAAILAVAGLEDELEALLRTKFPNATSNTKWKTIAGPGPKPLGTLNAKTDFAWLFGFYGPKTRKMINTIARIRNKFAHRTNIRDFDHPEVLPLCRELADNPIYPHSYIKHPPAKAVRDNFINTVKDLTDRLAYLRSPYLDLDDAPRDPLP